MSTKIAVIQFPGSNCDQDCVEGLEFFDGIKADLIWHKETKIDNQYDGVVLPGGFSYGDYLRSGAMAANSPIIKSLKDFAKNKPILGICNGFQVLTEAGLLPGALLKNTSTKFICKWVDLSSAVLSKDFHIPIAHGEGRYYVSDDGLKKLEDKDQIFVRYQKNPNGSTADIAGVTNEKGNIIGMMPHPERAVDQTIHKTTDGMPILKYFIEQCG